MMVRRAARPERARHRENEDHVQRLRGRVAVITGGASGIGAATARRFVDEGAQVVVSDLQDERGKALVEELGNDNSMYVHTDVTNEGDIEGAVATAVERFGQLDIMFNNAGIVGQVGPIASLDADEYDATMSVLLRAVVLGMKHAARVMIPRRSGSIISTSSMAGLIGGYGPHPYSTAKSAVVGLTQSVASELRVFGIRVNCICPGTMVTPMIAAANFGSPDALEQAREYFADKSPMGRAGLPEDIAAAAAYLASDDASYVTAEALRVDGGVTTAAPRSSFTTDESIKRGFIREAGRRGL